MIMLGVGMEKIDILLRDASRQRARRGKDSPGSVIPAEVGGVQEADVARLVADAHRRVVMPQVNKIRKNHRLPPTSLEEERALSPLLEFKASGGAKPACLMSRFAQNAPGRNAG